MTTKYFQYIGLAVVLAMPSSLAIFVPALLYKTVVGNPPVAMIGMRAFASSAFRARQKAPVSSGVLQVSTKIRSGGDALISAMASRNDAHGRTRY